MTLDELITGLESISDDPVIGGVAGLLQSWKSDDSTVTELSRDIERFIGNSWVEKDKEHEQMYLLWSEFRDQEIYRIDGKTMNERLYSFGLFDRFDACSEEDQLVVYHKLLASP